MINSTALRHALLSWLGTLLLTSGIATAQTAPLRSGNGIPMPSNPSLARLGINEPLPDPYQPRPERSFSPGRQAEGATDAWADALGVAPGQRTDSAIALASSEDVISYQQTAELGYPTNQPPQQQGKSGIFQSATLQSTWIDQDGTSGMGQLTWETSATFGFPAPTRQQPLLITPGYRMHLLDGPTTPDLPSQLHDAYLQVRWMGKINERWGFDLAVSPGIHSDFEQYDGDSIRINGRAVVSYQWNANLLLALGVVYYDRNDVGAFVAAGLIWTPHADLRVELIAPRPRVMWRIGCNGCAEDWLYLAGEFGGGTWRFDRAGTPDEVTISDYRVLVGLERKHPSGGGFKLEAGYVFARSVEFRSGLPDYEPDDSFLIRGGVSF